MIPRRLLVVLLAVCGDPATARTLDVGPGRTYASPSDAAAAAAPVGAYRDPGVFRERRAWGRPRRRPDRRAQACGSRGVCGSIGPGRTACRVEPACPAPHRSRAACDPAWRPVSPAGTSRVALSMSDRGTAPATWVPVWRVSAEVSLRRNRGIAGQSPRVSGSTPLCCHALRGTDRGRCARLKIPVQSVAYTRRPKWSSQSRSHRL